MPPFVLAQHGLTKLIRRVGSVFTKLDSAHSLWVMNAEPSVESREIAIDAPNRTELIISGMTCLERRKIAFRLTFITRSQDSSVMSTTEPCSSIPAEFSKPEIGPSSAARLATAAHSDPCVILATKGSMRAEAISSRPGLLMSTATTLAPQSAKCLADSRPRPDAAPVIQAAYKPHGSRPALGLRYTMLKKTGDEAVEVDAETVFHAGDRIRIAVEANDDGYLYVVNQGSSGTWKLLFPSPEIKNGDNHVQKRVRYEIPSGYTFTFDEQAGAEKLFIVLSRQPEPDLESLIYSLGHGAPGHGDKDKDKAVEKPKVMMASAAFSDDVIGRLRTAYARDLIVEKVDDEQPGPKREKAVYAVNPSGSADSRVVADITLKHQ